MFRADRGEHKHYIRWKSHSEGPVTKIRTKGKGMNVHYLYGHQQAHSYR